MKKKKASRTKPKATRTEPKQNRTTAQSEVVVVPVKLRTLAVVRAEIVEVESTIAALGPKLSDVLRRIREEDIEIDVLVTDSHGERISKRKTNPALKTQREVTATRGSLQRCLAALKQEEILLKEKRSNADAVDDLDALLNSENGAGHVEQKSNQ
jgi:hypothetical protein